jgi:hypothetical protein
VFQSFLSLALGVNLCYRAHCNEVCIRATDLKVQELNSKIDALLSLGGNLSAKIPVETVSSGLLESPLAGTLFFIWTFSVFCLVICYNNDI